VRGKHPILLIAPAIPSLATANRLAGMISYFIGLLVVLDYWIIGIISTI